MLGESFVNVTEDEAEEYLTKKKEVRPIASPLSLSLTLSDSFQNHTQNKRTNKQTNKQTNKRMNERTKERTNEQTNKRPYYRFQQEVEKSSSSLQKEVDVLTKRQEVSALHSMIPDLTPS